MFKVIYNGKTVTVYNVRYEEKYEDTMFLIYVDSKWDWVPDYFTFPA